MQSIIEKLKGEGALKLWHSYNAGHFQDLSGNGRNGTPTTVNFTGQGIQASAITSKVQVAHNAALIPTTGTIVIYGSFPNQYFSKFVEKSDGTTCEYGFYPANSTSMAFKYATTVLTYVINITQKKYLAVNYTSGAVPTMWADGQLQGNFSSTCTITASTNDLYILNDGSSARGSLNNTMGAVLIFNRELTATEHSAVYSELSNIKWPKKSFTQSVANLKVNPSEYGLKGAWDMRINGVTVPDVSTGGYNLTAVAGPVNSKMRLADTIQFDGSTQYLQNTTLTGLLFDADSMSGSCWFKSSTASDGYIMGWWAGGTNYQGLVRVNAGTNVSVTCTNAGGSVTNTKTTACNDGQWHHLVWTADGSNLKLYIDNVKNTDTAYVQALTEQNAAFTVGGRRSGGAVNGAFAGQVALVKLYNRVLTAQDVDTLYREGSRVLWKTDFGANGSVVVEGAVLSSYLSNTLFQFGDTTARYSVSTATINNSLVKTILCGTAGSLYLDVAKMNQNTTEACHGTWEFYVNKGADANSLSVCFAADTYTPATYNGYRFTISNAETGILSRTTNGSVVTTMISTAVGALPINTWHKIKITNTSAGVWCLYVNDVYIGTVSNTIYTTANYFVLDLDATDQVAYANVSGNYAISKFLSVI